MAALMAGAWPFGRGSAGVTVGLAVLAAGCGTWGFQAELLVRVVDARTGQAVSGALVEADLQERRTGPSGQARFTLKPAAYDVAVTHPAYQALVTDVMLAPNAVLARTVGLEPRSPGASPAPPSPGASPLPSGPPPATPGSDVSVSGRVTDPSGNRLPNADLLVESAWGIPLGQARTNAQGEFRVAQLPRGETIKLTVIATGFRSVTRTARLEGDWRLDFTGMYALRPDQPAPAQPGGPATVQIDGAVEDAAGVAVDGAFVRAESDNVRYPFTAIALTRYGHFEFKAPADIPIRFTATKPGYRPVTFLERLTWVPGAGPLRLDFTGGRALVPQRTP
ncbi:MAG: carboxypeptidase-like regulatory domain-containing protein [Candidatus Sericytochromatia bacterium]|nr:carboxypeptidase-like regulatory domain-containing protein [Candidatus Sericytochromatia bacterium]